MEIVRKSWEDICTRAHSTCRTPLSTHIPTQAIQAYTWVFQVRPSSAAQCTSLTIIKGIVLMNTHLALLAEEAGIGAEEEFLAVNDRYLSTALHLFPSVLHKPRTPARSSFLETSVGLATLMLIHTKTNDSHKYPWQKCLQIIERAAQDIVVESAVSDDDGCEVLYGRAGFLYALLRLRRYFAEDTVTEVGLAVNASNVISNGNIERVAANIIARGRFGGQNYAAQLRSDAGPRLMWSWHEKRYLGGAHGVGELRSFPSFSQRVSSCLHSRHSDCPTSMPRSPT